MLILAEEKGASSWLTTLPIEEHGFSLHKGAFSDALALRYGWTPSRSPTNCECGSSFSVEHALSCNKGGFPSLRHNKIRDLTAQLLTEVCNDVRVEPVLQTLTGEVFTGRSTNTTDGARLDIAANGFWGGRSEKCFFEVRVFNLWRGVSRSMRWKRSVVNQLEAPFSSARISTLLIDVEREGLREIAVALDRSKCYFLIWALAASWSCKAETE